MEHVYQYRDLTMCDNSSSHVIQHADLSVLVFSVISTLAFYYFYTATVVYFMLQLNYFAPYSLDLST